MLWVILRSQKVLQYNDANQVGFEGGCLKILKKEANGENFWRAVVPVGEVERIEWQKPCRIMKETKFNTKERY